MGKLIPLLFAGAGTATASVGGFYLVKSGGHHISDGNRSMVGAEDSFDPTQTAPSDTASDTLGFATLQEFKSGKGGVCAKRLFGSSGIDFENRGELINESKKLSDTEFTSAESTSSSAQSCLVVDWEKTNYSVDSDTKWKGHFRWS